ncbi:MAG: DUF6272 family protein [Candidatus Micrarchaeota archaeon]
MKRLFGAYVEQNESSQEYLVIHFSPTSVPLQQRWRNNGLSADFLAAYWATFFPAHDIKSQQRQAEIKGAINYIANEMLENVMKFSHKPTNYPVSLGLYLYEDSFKIYATNAIDPEKVSGFQAYLEELQAGDPSVLYLQQVERNAATEVPTNSQLGLLTMINDYQADLAWKFEPAPEDPNVTIVTTMVKLEL